MQRSGRSVIIGVNSVQICALQLPSLGILVKSLHFSKIPCHFGERGDDTVLHDSSVDGRKGLRNT